MPVASSILEESCALPRLLPVTRRTIGDDVLDTLRRAIIAGAFAPGDHLAEAVFAQQLGVSRAPVREAMMHLEREGLLVFDRRGAALVKEFTDADLEEIFSLRLNLEVMGARLACRRMGEEDFRRLEENIGRTRVVSKLVELTLLDVEFHDLVMQGAAHSRLQACWALVRHQLEYWLARMHNRVATPLNKAREGTAQNHQELVEILRSRREERAGRAFQEHIEGWRRQLVTAPKPTRRLKSKPETAPGVGA